MVSPDVFVDFDDVDIYDFVGGVVEISFPQTDGSKRRYEYRIPARILEKAYNNKDIGIVIDYLANHIATIQAQALGVKVPSDTFYKFLMNHKTYLENGIRADIAERIFENDFYSSFVNEEFEEDIRRVDEIIDSLHLEIPEFLNFKGFNYVIYYQNKSDEEENDEEENK